MRSALRFTQKHRGFNALFGEIPVASDVWFCIGAFIFVLWTDYASESLCLPGRIWDRVLYEDSLV